MMYLARLSLYGGWENKVSFRTWCSIFVGRRTTDSGNGLSSEDIETKARGGIKFYYIFLFRLKMLLSSLPIFVTYISNHLHYSITAP